VPVVQRKPFWLLPNLLSLDAPLVAMAWLYVFARTWRLYLPWEAYASLGLAVWMIYVADRLLDVSMYEGSSMVLEPRHEFHRDHRGLFRGGLGVALLLVLLLVFTRMPINLFKYLAFGVLLVAGFFGLSLISSHERHEVSYTKNIFAGITFAFGTAMIAHLYRYELGVEDLIASGEFKCFAVLCVLNICAIDLWEHADHSPDPEIKAHDELALTLPVTLLGAATIAYAVFVDQLASRPFFYAILTGSALLYVLNRCRQRFSTDAMRALADVALLIPVLVFFAASRG